MARASTWNPFSYWMRPQATTSGAVASSVAGAAAHWPMSTPFGTRCTLSEGSSNPCTTSRTMNREQAMTSLA